MQPSTFGFRGEYSIDPDARARHAGATGILRATPSAVAIPIDAADLAALVRWADDTGSRLHARGAATGMPGGNVAGGVAVDMRTHFRSPIRIDPGTPTATVPSGATPLDLNGIALPLGLQFPVDPSSGDRCTLGGMIANNSAGAHSVAYGSTRRWVDSLDLVLASGEMATLERGSPATGPLAAIQAELDRGLEPHLQAIRDHWPRVRKNSSGYALREYLDSRDLIDLIVGSEGTLALVTGAKLALSPLPRAVGLMVLEFDDLIAASDAVQRLLPFEPLTCELLDRTFIDLVRRGGGDQPFPLQPGLEAILLVEVRGEDHASLDSALSSVRTAMAPLALRTTATVDPLRMSQIWSVRHAASPIIAREAGARVSMQFIEDCVVPLDHLADFILGLRAALEHYDLPAVIFGHAGDGNLHVNPLIDVQRPSWRSTLENLLTDIADLVVRLGGTLSGEHGDGRLRAPLLHRVYGREIFGCFQRVKTLFDPKNILNPGTILPLPGQAPFDLLNRYPDA